MPWLQAVLILPVDECAMNSLLSFAAMFMVFKCKTLKPVCIVSNVGYSDLIVCMPTPS
jgi:hypothetical protein